MQPETSNMTEHTIDLARDSRGRLSATTTIVLDATRELRIVTSKDYRVGVSTDARVFTRRHDGASWSHAFGLAGGGDFSKTIAHDRAARATEKTLRDMHAAALAGVAALTAEARQHYADSKNV